MENRNRRFKFWGRRGRGKRLGLFCRFKRWLKRNGTGPNQDGCGPRGTDLGPRDNCPKR